MEWILLKILAGIVWIGEAIIFLFRAYTDICDFALTVFAVWLPFTQIYHWDNPPALVLGGVVGLVFYIIFRHRIGYWIVTPLYSFAWTWLLLEFVMKAMFSWKPNHIVYWVLAIAIFALSWNNHRYAFERKDINSEMEAKESAKPANI